MKKIYFNAETFEVLVDCLQNLAIENRQVMVRMTSGSVMFVCEIIYNDRDRSIRHVFSDCTYETLSESETTEDETETQIEKQEGEVMVQLEPLVEVCQGFLKEMLSGPKNGVQFQIGGRKLTITSVIGEEQKFNGRWTYSASWTS